MLSTGHCGTKIQDFMMKIAHESLMAGHLGVKKTTERIMSEFYWSRIYADIRCFCTSYDVCQRTIQNDKVTLGRMPLQNVIMEAFQRIAVDTCIIGPLQPITYKRNRYILTLVDYVTRYLEVIALYGIETERVAGALVDIFSRVGLPKEMLTDQDSQFTSDEMEEVTHLSSIN